MIRNFFYYIDGSIRQTTFFPHHSHETGNAYVNDIQDYEYL